MACLASLLVGLGVRVVYALLGVKSPAPPIVALCGLLGIVMGEHGLPWVKQRVTGWLTTPPSTAVVDHRDRQL